MGKEWQTLVSDYTDFSKLLKTSRKKSSKPKSGNCTAPQIALGVPGSSLEVAHCDPAVWKVPCSLVWWHPGQQRAKSDLEHTSVSCCHGGCSKMSRLSHVLKVPNGSVSKAPTIPWFGTERFLLFFCINSLLTFLLNTSGGSCLSRSELSFQNLPPN